MTFDKLYGLFNAKCATDPQLRALRKKLVSNTADFSDTAAYSERISNLLGETLSKYINNIPQGSREQICQWLLQEQYNNINTICADAQEALDEAQGISLTAQKAVYPTKRISQVAHALEDPTVKPEVIRRRANAPVANVAKSFHDDYIRVNAKQRNDLGLKPIIQRYGTGCCAWCSAVAGKYRFGEQPEDIFRRHDNCDCIIIYDTTVLRGKQTADGGRSKTWEEVDPKEVERIGLEGLTTPGDGDIIKITEEIIVKDIDKLENSGMKKADYNEYMKIIRNHKNQDIKRLYNEYANNIDSIKLGNDGFYSPGRNSIVFDYPQQRHIENGISKYSTLAHEYGHYFDAKASFENLHYQEIDAIHENVPFGNNFFKKVPSSSDDFLKAVRMDKERLINIGFSELKKELYDYDGSSGVQDAISGMFMGDKYVIKWCHKEDYYNRTYNSLKEIGKIGKTKSEKCLQSVYKSLGFDASNQAKVKSICRNYETASEMWANIMSGIVCGGEELEYVKKYLPNSYNAMLKILKGVK